MSQKALSSQFFKKSNDTNDLQFDYQKSSVSVMISFRFLQINEKFHQIVMIYSHIIIINKLKSY